MRISTSAYFNINSAAMQTKQSDLVYIQQQIATGRRIVTPSDDPVGATRALQTARALAASENNLENIKRAEVQIKSESTVLDTIRKAVSSARDVAIGANGNPSSQERTSFANYLEQIYKDLQDYANTTDAEGNYIFSGFKGDTAPFQQLNGASDYRGDSASRFVTISSGRQIQVSDSGQAIFGVGTADDPFALIAQLVTDLRDTTLTQPAYEAAIANAVDGLGNALDNIISISDQVARRFQELKVASDAETQFKLQYQIELDRVEAVDVQQAAIDLKMQQVSLEATQKAFISSTQLSLFSLL